MFARSLLLAAACSLLSGAALAADLPVYDPPPMEEAVQAPAYNWTGIYAGLNGGYGWGDTRVFNSVGFVIPTYDMEGAFFGGQLGANWQMNWLVLGAEADIQWSDIGGSSAPGCIVRCRTSIDWFGTARGRIGLAWDRFMIYGTGGLAFGEVNGSVNAGGFGTRSGSDVDVGWTAGAGAEIGITQHLSLKAEYLHVDLGRVNYGGIPPVVITHTAEDNDLVRAGLNWRF